LKLSMAKLSALNTEIRQADAQVYRRHHGFLATCESSAANLGVLDTTMIGRGRCEVECIRIQSHSVLLHRPCCESPPILAAHMSS
jgi:hypothetical protein